MTDQELMEKVLEAMEHLHKTGDTQVFDLFYAPELIPALQERLAQQGWLTEKAKEVALAERQAVLDTIDALQGMEDRHPLFVEGYEYALRHIEEFIKGRT